MSRKNRCSRPKPDLERSTLKLDEIGAVLDRAKHVLSAEDHRVLAAAVETLACVTQELESKGVSIKRLRWLLFGPRTEKTDQVLGQAGAGTHAAQGSDAGGERPKGKRKGHGRRGAAAYEGADRIVVPHESLARGACCPQCQRGKTYPQARPASRVRVRGMAPLQATVYELERLRCNLCGEVFTAQAPPDVGEQTYDETVTSMIALLKYGCGLPLNRIERLQKGMGIPLPVGTQWDLLHGASEVLDPALDELIRHAAQGEVMHNDDTPMKILELSGETREDALDNQENPARTGSRTSGIVCKAADREIALFFTGCQHAGENLADVLARRAADLPPPIQMCDALSHNTAGDFETILAHCNAHARRRFVEVADNFPDECRHVLETLREVYCIDERARKERLTPDERLRLHQAESDPLMNDLKTWLRAQRDERKVEPNSGLGEAIAYMLKHWKTLTLFLHRPGVPLDNNICERALKKAILHRKNSLFYKTREGARVGDLFMSLIYTAELNGVSPFDYLVALQRHPDPLAQDPAAWMPWNYADTLAGLAAGPAP
jgi:transposase